MQIFVRLYQKFSEIIHQMGKFGAVGITAFVVMLATTNLFWTVFGLSAVVGQILGGLCAMVVAFLGNRYWTFGERAFTGFGRETVLFLAMNAVALGLQIGCLAFTVYVLQLDGPLARNISGNFIGIALGVAFRFWSYRKWVFPEKAGEEAGASTAS